MIIAASPARWHSSRSRDSAAPCALGQARKPRLERNKYTARALPLHMPDISRILSAKTPLTLASVARGAQPLVMADLARAAKGRAVFIAPDEAGDARGDRRRAFFAPELQVIEFPAWDCLPYDRASPALSVSARRLVGAAPAAGKARPAPQLLVTTVNALLQRVLTPFRIRESVRELKPGMRDRPREPDRAAPAPGLFAAPTPWSTPASSRCAARSSTCSPRASTRACGSTSSATSSKRCGCSIPTPSARPARSTSTCCCPPARRCSTTTRVKRFRTRYRELFGANATPDPLYQAVSDGRRLAGMEHWLPLFEERLVDAVRPSRRRRPRGDRQRPRSARPTSGWPTSRTTTASAQRHRRARRRAATARSSPTRST